MVRNVILPIVFVMLPLGMINVMPKAATQEVKNLKISVVDNDHSSLSERLVHNLSASAYFHLADYSPSTTVLCTALKPVMPTSSSRLSLTLSVI